MSYVTPDLLKSLKEQSDRPYGSRYENPEVTRLLVEEIERLQRELERLRRSVG